MFPFCPIKSSKSKKSHQVTRNTDTAQSNPSHSTEHNQHATSTPYRYVLQEFHAREPDEISVSPGNVVLFEYNDDDPQGNQWSHVLCLKTNQSGYVPSYVLTVTPVENRRNKKLPRSTTNSLDLRPHHMHRICHIESPCPHFTSTDYYNLRSTESEYKPFELNFDGVYVVKNNFQATDENDISVKLGEYVSVYNKDDPDWYWVRKESRDYAPVQGFVPASFLCEYELIKAIANKGNSTITMKSSNQNDCHTYMNHGPH